MSLRFQRIASLVWLFLLGIPVVSAPYFDMPYEFEQPDGTKLTLILNGDEFYMEAQTPDGYTVVRDPQTGWICYAQLSDDGEELVSTGQPVEIQDSDSEQTAAKQKEIAGGRKIEKKLKIKPSSKLKKIRQKQKLLFGDDFQLINGQAYPADSTAAADSIAQPADDTQAAAAGGVLPPTKSISNFTGTIKGLVVIFDFSDAPAGYTLEQYRDKVNKANAYKSNGTAASLRTYYEDVSRGVFIMNHVVYGIFRAPQTFAYYDNLPYTEGARQLLSIALNQMEAAGFDFSQLTTFSSGEIRALSLMYTGNPKAWAEGMWYHAGSWSGFSADGVRTGRYCTDSANNLDPGTLIHEHGHMAAEWPDTYSYVGGEPGTWDIMGGGYTDLPNPYFLYENGWLDAENIRGFPGLKTMASNDPYFAYAYYDPDQPTEFYFIRPYVTSLLYCPSIPDQGMTFWRINTQGDNSNYPNTDRHIELVHANNTDTNKTSNVCFKEGGLLNQFTAGTTPSSNWKFGAKAGQPSGMDITQISAAASTMTFVIGTAPAPVPYYAFNGSFSDASTGGYAASGNNFSAPSCWTADTAADSFFDLQQALQFDGVDDYVVCPAAVGTESQWTIAFWMKPQQQQDMTVLDKMPAGSGGAGWRIQLRQDGRIALLIGSGSNNTAVLTPWPVYEPGRWTHAAYTFSGGTAKIFINGALRMVKNGIPQTPVTAAAAVWMGMSSQVDGGLPYKGLLDDVRFYNTALEAGPLNAIDGLNLRPDKGPLALLKLDDISGTRAEDISGHNNHGTLNNGLSFETNSTSGPVGRALSFDGVDDYIALPSGMAKRNSGFTVALWACPTAVKGWARFIDFGNGSSSDNILLARYQSTSDLTLEVYNGSVSGGHVRATNAIELNKWQFFAAAVDADGNVKIYKNGQVVKTGKTAAPRQLYRRNLFIGRSNWSADSYYQGAMDDIRLYNYALSDAEITAVYTNSRLDGPIPYSGSNQVSPETVLQFTPAANALRHDIYFGTQYSAVAAADTGSPEYVGRKQAAQYNPPLLDGWREYFWRVDERMIDGTVQTGPVWRFSTVGSIQRQVWTGLSGVNEIAGLTSASSYPANPSLVEHLDTFEIPANWADNYGTRLHGLLVPQTTGSVRFWISGDNEVELWLSTDADPAHAARIAYIYGTWSNPRSFDQYASQRSALFTLQAGQPYYIMALHKEGDGGDHLAVAWQGPDSPDRSIIDGFWLRPPRDNEWPHFEPALPAALNAPEGAAFQAVMPVRAADPDTAGLNYAKQAGPAWLHIASDGRLWGTPQNGDVGLNSFTIRAGDGRGGFDDLILSVDVPNRFTGSQGLEDLTGFAHEWLNPDSQSPANLNQAGAVTFDDWKLLAAQWSSAPGSGLAAYWAMDDSIGQIARDSQSHHHAILTHMTEHHWVGGISQNALAFDGIDDYVEAVGYKGITGSASRTCTAWIKTTVPGTNILSWGAAQTGRLWAIALSSDGTLRVQVYGDYIYGTTPLTDGQWHHIAVMLPDDGSPNLTEAVLYVDGLPETSIGGSATCPINTAASADVCIGANVPRTIFYKGVIDEVRLYDRLLSRQEIEKLALRRLQLYLPLDETAGLTAADYSAKNRIGQLFGQPAWKPGMGVRGGAVSFDGIDDYIQI
ncbi:MAG TPA: hypothetical protein P5324_11790, partial [Anaerohalosphaeraceae bacterium]|nr:hypothetical protein [Anaerohalosphaeraceae bacterium]